jgi:hypothetical protein
MVGLRSGWFALITPFAVLVPGIFFRGLFSGRMNYVALKVGMSCADVILFPNT